MSEELATERAFYDRWSLIEREAGSDNLRLASLGGAVSDRLAWVFMSGYQAAVRSCFPELAGSGWTAFAAAEPKDGPACTLEEAGGSWRLNGEKSWIAGASHLDRLVVAIGQGSERCFVGVGRNAPGMAFNLPRAPGFLPELSQGAAVFDAVLIDAGRILRTPERSGWFRAAEPFFVLAALNACMAAQASGVESAAAVADAAADAAREAKRLAPVLRLREAIKPGLDGLRALTKATVAAFERTALDAADPSLQHSWRADRRLLEMFQVAGD